MCILDYNYHTHKYMCGHASGKPEEYVIRAIENGIKYMGFSEHFPNKFDDGRQSSYRLQVEDIPKYIEIVRYLKEKYKDRIDISLGFEMEYYSEMFDVMLENAKSYGADYLILGEHFANPENTGAPHMSVASTEGALDNYVNHLIDAMKTQVFTYVAHPDLPRFNGDIEILKEAYKRICDASNEYNIPLEINFLGIREKRFYPNELFLEVAGEKKSPITFGFDAHDVHSAFDGDPLKIAKGYVEKYKLNYIARPSLKKLGE